MLESQQPTRSVSRNAVGSSVAVAPGATSAAAPSSPVASATAPDRARARDALTQLDRAIEDHASAHRRWTSSNWIEFYRYANGNPRLSWTGDVADGVYSNALGNAVSDGSKFVAKRAVGHGITAATTAAGGALGNVPGLVVGFVVGVLIETAVGLIYAAVQGSPADQAADQASARTAALIENQEQALEGMKTKVVNEGRTTVDQKRKVVEASTDPGEIAGIEAFAKSEANDLVRNKPLSNRSLADSMLHDWVLEHAGDEEDAASGTSEVSWEAARTRAFGKGDSLDRHPEIFAYQTRAHFNKAGLDTAAAFAMAADANERVNRPPAPRGGSRYRDISERATMQGLLKDYDGRRFTFRSARDADALISFIAASYGQPTDAAKRAVTQGRFTLVCALDLDEDDGAVYVDEWDYTLLLSGDTGYWWVRASPPHARRNPVEFSVSPD